MVPQLPEAQSDVFKCLVLPKQQSKTQRCSIYCHMRQQQAGNAPN